MIISTHCGLLERNSHVYTCKAEKETSVSAYILDRHLLVKLEDAKERDLFSRWARGGYLRTGQKSLTLNTNGKGNLETKCQISLWTGRHSQGWPTVQTVWIVVWCRTGLSVHWSKKCCSSDMCSQVLVMGYACMYHFSCVRLCVTPWTAAPQAPPSTGFPKQEYWIGLPLPSSVMS